MNRLLKFWIAEAGFDPKKYGNESLRRTKALHVLKGTGDLGIIRMLLGHAKIESTARFLRVPTTSDPIAIKIVEHSTSDVGTVSTFKNQRSCKFIAHIGSAAHGRSHRPNRS